MTHFTLEQIDHAMEWALRRLTIAEGYWPDVVALHAAGATAAQLKAAKQAITGAGKELVEVLGVGGADDRGELKGNNVIVSRLAPGRGSYATGRPYDYFPVNPNDLSQGYSKQRVAAGPQKLGYEVRFVSDDTKMDRKVTEWILAVFGEATYLYGLNNDLSQTPKGFWVVPVGEGIDLSGPKFTERAWRLEVRDVRLIAPRFIEHVPAAVDLGLTLGPTEEEEVTVTYPPES